MVTIKILNPLLSIAGAQFRYVDVVLSFGAKTQWYVTTDKWRKMIVPQLFTNYLH